MDVTNRRLERGSGSLDMCVVTFQADQLARGLDVSRQSNHYIVDNVRDQHGAFQGLQVGLAESLVVLERSPEHTVSAELFLELDGASGSRLSVISVASRFELFRPVYQLFFDLWLSL